MTYEEEHPDEVFTDEAGRQRRTSDWYYESLDLMIEEAEAQVEYLRQVRESGGLLHGPEGPLGLQINPRPFSDAHFAVFPERLIEPLVKASAASKSCAECGAPWERVIRKDYENPVEREQESQDTGWTDKGRASKKGGVSTGEYPTGLKVKTMGFRPTCSCESGKTVPSIVLDPFLGSGTVGVVAEKLGRRWLGSDLSLEYCQIALKRLKKEGGELKLDAFLDL
jgi:hypothetical protein